MTSLDLHDDGAAAGGILPPWASGSPDSRVHTYIAHHPFLSFFLFFLSDGSQTPSHCSLLPLKEPLGTQGPDSRVHTFTTHSLLRSDIDGPSPTPHRQGLLIPFNFVDFESCGSDLVRQFK